MYEYVKMLIFEINLKIFQLGSIKRTTIPIQQVKKLIICTHLFITPPSISLWLVKRITFLFAWLSGSLKYQYRNTQIIKSK